MSGFEYPFRPEGEEVASVEFAECEEVAFREHHQDGKGLFAIFRGPRKHGDVVEFDEYTLADNLGPVHTFEGVVVPANSLAEGDEVTVHEKTTNHKGAIVAGAILTSMAVVAAGTIKIIRSRQS